MSDQSLIADINRGHAKARTSSDVIGADITRTCNLSSIMQFVQSSFLHRGDYCNKTVATSERL